MPSPIAHVGAALAWQMLLRDGSDTHRMRDWLRTNWKLSFAAAFASVAPDLDILLAAIHPAGLAWHRGPTHSLVGAAVIGALVAGLARLRGARAWATVIGAAVLHVPFDWSTGDPGAPVRYGVPWAWPFSPVKSIDPHPWFGAFRIDEQGFLANMWAPHALPVYLGEVGTAAALIGGVVTVRWLLGSARAG